MSHSQHHFQNKTPQKTAKNPAPNTSTAPDCSQGSLTLGQHRAQEKAAQQPPPENHATSHSDDKFPFPTGAASDENENEKNRPETGSASGSQKTHHVNPPRNTFPEKEAGNREGTEARAAIQTSRLARDAQTHRTDIHIKQPSKSSNGN